MIVLMASAIAATTAMAVLIRSYSNYVDSTKQSLADNAKEAAEAGLNILVESLNQDHPEWLIEPYDGNGNWSISRDATGGCRTKIASNPAVKGISNIFSNGTEGRYKLTKYSFHGNNFYGGVGSFEMEGEIRSGKNKLLASAKIYQDMTIIAKACDALPGDAGEHDSLWPGILVNEKIDRYFNARAYIKGSDPMKAATILCLKSPCHNKSDWSSIFPPEATIGDMEKPPAQEPPEGLKGMNKKEMDKLLRQTINNHNCRSLKIPEDIPEHAKTYIDGTWHIYFKGSKDTFSFQGKSSCKDPYKRSIKIQGGAPVRLHLASGLSVKSRTWIDTTEIKHAADFMILGTSSQKKSINIRGESPKEEAIKTFIWAPNSDVRFWRGKRTIEGAIWADKFYGVGHGIKQSGSFDVVVPEDMPQLIYQRLGKEFGIGQRDYVAQGVSSWRSYGRTTN